MSQDDFIGFSDASSRLVALIRARDEAKQEMVGALICAHHKQARRCEAAVKILTGTEA